MECLKHRAMYLNDGSNNRTTGPLEKLKTRIRQRSSEERKTGNTATSGIPDDYHGWRESFDYLLELRKV